MTYSYDVGAFVVIRPIFEYPTPADKVAAPVSESIKSFFIFEKTKSSIKGTCTRFVVLIFRYINGLFRRKEKLYCDRKSENKKKN